MTTDLFDYRKKSIQELFEADIQARPQVWDAFKKEAERLLRAGFKKYGSMTILQHLRWHAWSFGKDTTGFKVNNIFAPCFARKLMAEESKFKEFFNLRGD